MRAALLTACVLGYSTLRCLLGSLALDDTGWVLLTERLGEALQGCVTAP